MTRVGKLMKLKSAIKRLPSLTKFGRSPSGSHLYASPADSKVSSVDAVSHRSVYVGRSRRRYLVAPEIVEHPLFQELVDKSRSAGAENDSDFDVVAAAENDAVFVACEVVMFEHLLWMLHNAEAAQLAGPTDELVEFYTC